MCIRDREHGLIVEDVDVGDAPDLREIPKDTADGEPRCVLCGRESSDKLGAIELYGKHKSHRKCMLWSSEVHEDEAGNLMCTDDAVKRGRRIKCSECGQRGASVGCNRPKCKNSYHYLCAFKAKALLSKKTQRCYCCKHLDEELQDLYPPVSLQGNDGNGKRQRPVPNEYFGGGKIARLSFKSRYPEKDGEEIKTAWRSFLKNAKYQPLLKTTDDAMAVEAHSVNWPGSWWPGVVLGAAEAPDGLTLYLVRFDEYGEELDEWKPLEMIRHPTGLIDSLEEIPPPGTKLSVYCDDEQWRDGIVEMLDNSIPALTVVFCDDAGPEAGETAVITGNLIDKLSLYLSPFEFDRAEHARACALEGTGRAACKKPKLAEVGPVHVQIPVCPSNGVVEPASGRCMEEAVVVADSQDSDLEEIPPPTLADLMKKKAGAVKLGDVQLGANGPSQDRTVKIIKKNFVFF
eukprot:TRINITY_DN10435_c0_g1_i4.p1 TRINITY_DN10435_c0_g1~~TRINITY_DN10435_c0_g1_i4.p1  ORF type:complete len:459 (-),score=120.85 TRINITY_DN10435_c0_g1_i4:940-2316(-)